MSRIRFTIVITCHNQRDFIEQAVKSALSQSYPADQIIVVDDGSTDDSVKVIEPYAKQIELIQLASNCGALVARNTGCAAASGDYLVFLDGDIEMPLLLFAASLRVQLPDAAFGVLRLG